LHLGLSRRRSSQRLGTLSATLRDPAGHCPDRKRSSRDCQYTDWPEPGSGGLGQRLVPSDGRERLPRLGARHAAMRSTGDLRAGA